MISTPAVTRLCPILVAVALAATGCDKKETKPSSKEPPADYGKCESTLPGDAIDLTNDKFVLELVKKDGRGGAVATLEQMLKRCARARVAGIGQGATSEIVILDVEVKDADGKALLPFKFRDYPYLPSATQTVTFSAPASEVGKDKAIELTVRAARGGG
jgi:hypothetical protein